MPMPDAAGRYERNDDAMPRGLGPRGFLTDEEKKNKPKTTKSLLLAFATLTVSQIIGVLESYVNAWISQRIIYDMKNQMYDHLQHMPHAFFTSEKQGDIITRMNTDISGGIITESGDHETLLAQNGIYRELYETQFRKVLEYEAEVHPPVLPGPGFGAEET